MTLCWMVPAAFPPPQPAKEIRIRETRARMHLRSRVYERTGQDEGLLFENTGLT